MDWVNWFINTYNEETKTTQIHGEVINFFVHTTGMYVRFLIDVVSEGQLPIVTKKKYDIIFEGEYPKDTKI